MYQPTRDPAIDDLIAERYAKVHGADVHASFAHYCTVGDAAGPRAVLGYANAAAGRLFLERYLDVPVETAVADALGLTASRDRIVEIGAHASVLPPATLALWARAAEALGADHDVAVAVLTAPLRTMFIRLGLPFTAIAPADPARLGGEERRWGRYYELDPVVCAGAIAPWRTALAQRLAGDVQ